MFITTWRWVVERHEQSRSTRQRRLLPPWWAILTVILGGLAVMVWYKPINFSNIGDIIGAVVGVICFAATASFIIWGVVMGAIAYFKNLRIALPATAATALVSVVLWQVFDGLGPTGKFVMIGVIVVAVFLVGNILQS